MNALRPAPVVPMAWVALLSGLLPFIVVHLCYAVSVWQGHIPGCIPYLDGCTSISAAGRHGASYFLFKAGMLPAAVLLAMFWLLCREWLIGLGDRPGPELRAMVWIGLTAAVFLALYTVFLGSKGDFYNFMRRFGVTVYFSFSYLAQLLLLARLSRLTRSGLARLPAWILSGKLGIGVTLMMIGLASIPVKNFMADPDRLENAIEWIFALLMVSYYLLTWRAWRATGFRAAFRIGP
jgi:hypothetical protein